MPFNQQNTSIGWPSIRRSELDICNVIKENLVAVTGREQGRVINAGLTLASPSSWSWSQPRRWGQASPEAWWSTTPTAAKPKSMCSPFYNIPYKLTCSVMSMCISNKLIITCALPEGSSSASSLVCLVSCPRYVA